MSLPNDVAPLLSELTDSKREEAMSHFEIISPLFGKKTSRDVARGGSKRQLLNHGYQKHPRSLSAKTIWMNSYTLSPEVSILVEQALAREFLFG